MNRSELLITYGHRILESNQFANAKDQKHHFRTDVASLSINVALFCIAFYQLLSLFHIKLNLATLIIAALAHDLGIIGRRENFSSNYQCLKGHPKDSVAAVREIIPEVDIRVCDAISSHMFPPVPDPSDLKRSLDPHPCRQMCYLHRSFPALYRTAGFHCITQRSCKTTVISVILRLLLISLRSAPYRYLDLIDHMLRMIQRELGENLTDIVTGGDHVLSCHLLIQSVCILCFQRRIVRSHRKIHTLR